MSKHKPVRISLNERFSLEGTAYDWRLVEHYQVPDRKDKKKTVDAEKHTYYSRLNAVAVAIVNKEAMLAGNLEELVDIIRASTNAIVKRLDNHEVDRDFMPFDSELEEIKREKKTAVRTAKERKQKEQQREQAEQRVEAEESAAEEPAAPPVRRRRRRKAAGKKA